MYDTYIYDAVRTPIGLGQADGALYEVKPIDLLAALLYALEDRNKLPNKEVDDLIIGCVNPVDDQGSNLAKAALLYSKWDKGVSGFQINREECSGLEAINLAATKIKAGANQLVIAGGLECMSRVPRGKDRGPINYDSELLNVFDFVPSGISADLLATLEGFDRQLLDQYTTISIEKAQAAQQKGYYKNYLIPFFDRNGLIVLGEDERLTNSPETSLEDLNPSFLELGQTGYDAIALHHHPILEKIEHNHTLASTAQAADAAALLLLGNQDVGKALNLSPKAKIISTAVGGGSTSLRFGALVEVIRKALKTAQLKFEDIHCWECSEDFAAIPLKLLKDLPINKNSLNVNGGSLAWGHPLGATGCIQMIHLLNELEQSGQEKGMVVTTSNSGMVVATIIERV